jgi:hypothetical protein
VVVCHLSYGEEVLDRTVGVEEGGAHGCVDISPREAHALHVSHSRLALVTHSQSRGVIEAGPGCLSCRRGRGCSAGAFCDAADDGAGAEGAAGVCAAAGAGVEGATLLDDAGAAFGLETMHTMKPFSSMLYDSTVFAS